MCLPGRHGGQVAVMYVAREDGSSQLPQVETFVLYIAVTLAVWQYIPVALQDLEWGMLVSLCLEPLWCEFMRFCFRRQYGRISTIRDRVPSENKISDSCR